MTPPVDVVALLSSRAEVQRLDWTFEVDAILIGLSAGARPRVYYKATSNPLRERFTLAHELAHLLLPWHLPRANCHVGSGALDLADYGLEDEADVFASCLLVPDAWLVGLVEQYHDDMSSLLEAVALAEVSTPAMLLALKRVLLAGWVFTAYGTEYCLETLGTASSALSSGLSGPDLTIALQAEAHSFGEVSVNGYPVYWYRMSEPTDLPETRAETRPLTTILIDAISVVEPDDQKRVKIARSCNGKVGGILREASGRPARETYAALLHRFQSSELAELTEQPDFLAWLARKALDIEGRTTKRYRGR